VTGKASDGLTALGLELFPPHTLRSPDRPDDPRSVRPDDPRSVRPDDPSSVGRSERAWVQK
jgi:hypothetical protein